MLAWQRHAPLSLACPVSWMMLRYCTYIISICPDTVLILGDPDAGCDSQSDFQ